MTYLRLCDSHKRAECKKNEIILLTRRMPQVCVQPSEK
ncbi:MAG: hypothetical protein EP350_02860 [Alphaproteobacteria bacterium]|nr:MAG: hypothetical protein EP350_02860 [Alphaproteobacteria bacterium]